MRLGIILVHYHTPDLLVRAVRALRKDLSTNGLEADIVVVDNGSTPDERACLVQLPVRVIQAERNLGYAGGVNLGVTQTDADILIFMNPDVEVLNGCLPTLVQTLENGAAAAGPRFYWDHGKRFHMAPLPEKTHRLELFRRTAVLGAGWAYRVRTHRRQQAYRHWLAERPFVSYQLVGAFLAVQRRAWEQVGPFDDGFQLYYEELDWLIRLKRQGLPAYYVPAAEAVHLYNQSASQEALAKQWFVESTSRFEKLHYGVWFSHLLDYGSRIASQFGSRFGSRFGNLARQYEQLPLQHGPPVVELTFPGRSYQSPLWIEIAADLLGVQFVAMTITAEHQQCWQFPPDVWPYLEPGRYVLQVVDRVGEELSTCVFEK